MSQVNLDKFWHHVAQVSFDRSCKEGGKQFIKSDVITTDTGVSSTQADL